MVWRPASSDPRRPVMAGAALWVNLVVGCGGDEAAPVESPVVAQAEPAVRQAIEAGEALFFERAVCFTCHRVGERGNMIVGPNLGIGDGMEEPLVARARRRRPELSPIEYVIESMLDPDAIVVPSYAPGTMKSIDDLPLDLDDRELVQIAAFVAMQGAPEPLTPQDLERAEARLAPAREARAARRANNRPQPVPPPR